MSAPRKFDAETRARAVRLYEDRLRDHDDSKLALASTWASCWMSALRPCAIGLNTIRSHRSPRAPATTG